MNRAHLLEGLVRLAPGEGSNPSSDTAEQACLIHERFLSRDRFWPAVKLPDSTRSTTARLGPGIESVARTFVAAEDWHRR